MSTSRDRGGLRRPLRGAVRNKNRKAKQTNPTPFGAAITAAADSRNLGVTPFRGIYEGTSLSGAKGDISTLG